MNGLNPALEALAGKLTQGPMRGPVIAHPDLTEILAMSLDRFAREGQLLEVRVPWLGETLWFVPDERDAAVLGRKGVSRGRIWTARELMELGVLRDRASEAVQTLAVAKAAVDGDIVMTLPAR